MSADFNEADLHAIRQFYEAELVQTVARYEHLQNILGKLGVQVGGIRRSGPSGPAAAAATPMSMAKPAKKAPKRKGKRGRKPIWAAYILKTLKDLDRPIMYQDMVRAAQIAFNVNDENIRDLKAAVNQASFRLRTVHKKIDTYGKKGRKEKYIVLKSWYNDQGELEKKYADMCVFPD